MSFVILFFQSHYGHISRLEESTSACGARKPQSIRWSRGARPLISFRLSVNSPSSPVNGHSEGRWSIANVGIHSYISTKSSSTSSEHLYSVALWLCPRMQKWSYYHCHLNGWHLLLFDVLQLRTNKHNHSYLWKQQTDSPWNEDLIALFLIFHVSATTFPKKSQSWRPPELTGEWWTWSTCLYFRYYNGTRTHPPRLVKRPIRETEIPAAVKDGTSQTVNWRLLGASVSLETKLLWGKEDLQNREEGINADRVNGSDLWIVH